MTFGLSGQPSKLIRIDAEYMWVGRRPVAMLEALRSARSEQLRNLATQDPVESRSLTHPAEWLYLSARVQP